MHSVLSVKIATQPVHTTTCGKKTGYKLQQIPEDCYYSLTC